MSLPKHLAGLFTLLLSVSPIAALAAPLYSITTLGNIGSNSSNPLGMNNSGQAVGYAYDGSNVTSAFMSNGGVMTNLNPPGASSSYASGINNAGVAVGQVDTGTTSRAVTFSGGTAADLGSLGDSATSSYGSAINNSGQVAGVSYLAGNSGAYHAFQYTAGAMLDLGTLGGANSYGRGINDAGSVVGYSEVVSGASNYHAFRYSGGSMVDLGTLGGTYSDAYAINSSGTAVGLSYLAGDAVTRAFMYSGGGMIDLGSLGGANSYAYGVNSAGQVVGGSEFSAGNTDQYAFLYSGGGMIDLNTLIDPTSEWTLNYAAAINDNNQILAHGCTRAGVCQGLLLTLAEPVVGAVPEPGTFALAGLGLAALGWTRKRKGQKQAA
jgi:probable HAF family extracellular repeat protein